MSESRWLAPKELAVSVGVDVRTVRRWIAKAEPSLEVLRIAGTVRVRVRVPACPSMSSANLSETHAHS